MKYSNSKEINDIVKILIQKYDCTVKKGRKHCRVIHPKTRRSISISSTPSDRNAWKAFVRDIKKYLNIVFN